MMYTLNGSCKLHGVAPVVHLRHVLATIADHPINKIKDLLPWNLSIPAIQLSIRRWADAYILHRRSKILLRFLYLVDMKFFKIT